MPETTNSINNNGKPYKLDENTEAMLSYLPFIGLFTSLAIFMMEKENKFVRFHAMQGLLFALAYVIINMGLGLTIVLAIFVPIINLAAFIVWLFMMWKAYNREEFHLPVIGKIATDQINK
jgi:uncharacterized membrane protein